MLKQREHWQILKHKAHLRMTSVTFFLQAWITTSGYWVGRISAGTPGGVRSSICQPLPSSSKWPNFAASALQKNAVFSRERTASISTVLQNTETNHVILHVALPRKEGLRFSTPVHELPHKCGRVFDPSKFSVPELDGPFL